jgi:hypothetical protein
MMRPSDIDWVCVLLNSDTAGSAAVFEWAVKIFLLSGAWCRQGETGSSVRTTH